MDEKARWIKTIHTARNRTGIGDEAYRAILAGCAGVDSSREITTKAQYDAVMSAFRKLGFRPRPKTTIVPQGRRAPGKVTARQEYYIRGLWSLASRSKDEAGLRSFVRRITGAADVSWLSKADASKVILALRDLAVKAGYDPDKAFQGGEDKCC